LNSSGQIEKSSTKLENLKFTVEEQEAELETRDMN
jgi:hypothetical protein